MKTYFNWSTGKDAALALYYLQQDEKYEVMHLLTSMNSQYNRVSMHGIRRALWEQQVESIGIPFSTIELPEEPGMEVYESKMREKVEQLKADGITMSAFGDIHLEDLRAYRETQLKKLAIKACFPLWKRDTKELLLEFLDLGFKAVVSCIQSESLDTAFVGRDIDREFIQDLPSNVDPCGENGEFHTFCYDGPIFNSPIEFTLGERIYKEYKTPGQDDDEKNEKLSGFYFCDIIPKDK